MGEHKNLTDLFHHQLRDLYSAEEQLIKALPEMREKASNKDLKQAISEHLEETEQQKKRLDKIADELNIEITGEKCEAMEGLIREAKSFVTENSEGEVRDAGIIADAQRIEHYEIAGYGTVTHFARALGKDKMAETLQKTLDEESKADEILNNLAVNNVNVQAREKETAE